MSRTSQFRVAASLVTSALLALTLTVRTQDRPGPGQALHALLDAEWQWELEQDPIAASYLGDRRYNDRWRDDSLEAIERRHAHRVDALARLRSIDREGLTPADRLNYDLFEKDLRFAIEDHAYRRYLLPLDQRSGIHTASELVDLLRFQTVKDYEDWISRLRALPAAVDQTIALMREGMRTGMLWPRVTMERLPAQIERQLAASPEQSHFYQPFARFPPEITEAERARLSNAARSSIASDVVPALQRLHEFVAREYVPASLKAVGIWQWPNGEKAYAFLARRFTTTDMTPTQIHEKGLAEVARIRAEMQAVMARVGFSGTLESFFVKLRTSPEFYYASGEDLLEGYRAIAKRIDPEIVKVVATPPRTPYGVVPIPEHLAPETTTAYYNQPAADGSRAGLYYVNLHKPEMRPKYEMMALSLHEAVPGHHLQIARAMELGGIPEFRRYGGYTAFVEGWGLYAESLGDELGLYDDPYSKFGQLTYEMWRAVRLVVDTGMHAYQWDRQKAIEYFRANAAKSELDIVNEIDRYITNPGQALAYKIGELKLKELRTRARKALGEQFDVREFHDVVLGSGAVPLDVLEAVVERWIEQRKSGGTGSTMGTQP